MGENKHINELDAFAKKYIKDIQPEQPSLDFTANLMQKINEASKVNVVKTKSLISKKGWFGIAVLVVATLCITFLQVGESSLQSFKLSFSFLDKLQTPDLLKNVSFSNTTIYAFLFFGIMMVVQFTYLKNYFDKRLES